MRRLGTAVVLVLLLATRLLAGPVEDLSRLIRTAMASPEPATALLKGFLNLGDFEISGPDVARALADAGSPADGPCGLVLGNGASVSKKGGVIRIRRTEDATFPLVVGGQTKGWARLGREVSFRVRQDGAVVVIDDFDGVKLGEKKDGLYDLWKVRFEKDHDKPVVRLTAGWGLFSKTVTIALPEPKPPAAPVAPATATATPGGATPGGATSGGATSEPAPERPAAAPPAAQAPAQPPAQATTPGLVKKVGAD